MTLKKGATILFLVSFLFFFAQHGFAEQETLPNEAEAALKDLANDTLSYFNLTAGRITAVEGKSVTIDAGSQEVFRKGMRLNAFKEGTNFVHPVTKEPLGKIDVPIGVVEITSVAGHGAAGTVIRGNPENFMDARLKIPSTKVKVLFYQGDTDWVLGDRYYQMLKESGRFELIDTGIDTNDIPQILVEAKAKGADAALILHSGASASQVTIAQQLFWVGETKEFAAKNVTADKSSVKELRYQAGLYLPSEGEVLLQFHLPFKANRMAAGDLAGDGNQEILLVAGNTIRIYHPGVDLKSMEKFTVPGNEVLWLDTIALNKSGKDDILITAMQDGKVISYIYELQDSKFVMVLQLKDRFLRKIGNQAIVQEFDKRSGYEGPVYSFTLADNTFKKGESLKLPEGVNIYDFQRFDSPEGKRTIAAWDENGFLQVYNDKGVRLWMSKEPFGGFLTTFDKEAATVIVGRGKWSVKDRLLVSNNELLAPKRKPLLGMAKGLGYSTSSIKGLWWNGSAIEERDFIDKAGGEILDYDLAGDRLMVLAKGSITTKAANIFKGESPFGVTLSIYSVKGR